MDWTEFSRWLLDNELRLSSLEVENLTCIRQQIVDRWKRGGVNKPQRNTIRRLEDGLNIKIDDRDPENITYQRIKSKTEKTGIEGADELKLHKFKLISTVYAGESSSMFIEENIEGYTVLPYSGDPENCFALRVKGDSMNHSIVEGDVVLADMKKEVRTGDIVVVRLRDGRQLVKRYKELEMQMVMLYSDNGGYPPIMLRRDEVEAIYRVVGIWKQT
jgi:SOS-response transcriptional repressor LexA